MLDVFIVECAIDYSEVFTRMMRYTVYILTRKSSHWRWNITSHDMMTELLITMSSELEPTRNDPDSDLDVKIHPRLVSSL